MSTQNQRKGKNQRAFIGGSWSDCGERRCEKVNTKFFSSSIKLLARQSSAESSYFSDENSSIDDLILENEYDKLCKMSLKIITKNKRLKATRDSFRKEISILNEKVSTLKKNKEVDLECVKCHMLKMENEKLKEEALKLTNPSSSETKEFNFVKAQKEVFPCMEVSSNMGGPFICAGGPPKQIWDRYQNHTWIEKSNLRGNIIGKGQICDNKCRVTFSEHDSEITKDGKVIGRGIRKKGLYVMKLGNKPKDKICLATIDENSTLWHRRLGHANMRLIQSLASKELVRNLPKLKFDQHFCDACKIGKQAQWGRGGSHKA
ncbi:retrovirus-related pol polyprotein from transposon TNT 1-94 [Tanacetum coccineum]